MKELIEFIVKSLVDLPNEVNINEVEGEKVTLIELHVAKTDVGKVIGKKGKTAVAIRTIINAISTKQGKSIKIEIME
jgi:predicted RNA-binding protein YlqC (UPF0109 family)